MDCKIIVFTRISIADHVAVPDMSAGAMENWGLVIYRESALLHDEEKSSIANKFWVSLIVAHEIAHSVSYATPTYCKMYMYCIPYAVHYGTVYCRVRTTIRCGTVYCRVRYSSVSLCFLCKAIFSHLGIFPVCQTVLFLRRESERESQRLARQSEISPSSK